MQSLNHCGEKKFQADALNRQKTAAPQRLPGQRDAGEQNERRRGNRQPARRPLAFALKVRHELARRVDHQHADGDQHRGQADDGSSVIDLLRDPATRDSPLYRAGPTPRAKGRFLWNESGEGHIFVSDLPTAPEGKMYAVWTIAEQSAPRYVGTIQTDAAGKGGLHINAERSDRPVETFAVTVEPIGSTAAPTGPMVLISKSS